MICQKLMPATEDYAELDKAISAIPGVISSGLFVGLVDELITVRDGAITRVDGPGAAFW